MREDAHRLEKDWDGGEYERAYWTARNTMGEGLLEMLTTYAAEQDRRLRRHEIAAGLPPHVARALHDGLEDFVLRVAEAVKPGGPKGNAGIGV